MKSFKKSQAIIFWGTSYLVLLVLFITNIVVVFSLNQKVANRMNDKYCNILLGGISENAQEAVDKTGDIYSSVVNYKNLRDVMGISDAEGYFESEAATELLELFSVYKDESMDFYLYIPHTDSIISPGGIYDTHMYHSIFIQPYNIPYDEWVNMHSGSEYTDSIAEGEFEQIMFREEYTDSVGKRAVLVTVYDEDYLLDIDDLPEWTAECDIYLSDMNGNIFMRRQNSKIDTAVETALEIKSAYNEKWDMFEKRLYSAIPCNITIAYPEGAAWAELDTLKNMEVVLSFVLMVLCVIIMIGAIKRNYNPIYSILKALNISDSRREYDDIEKSVTELLSQNKLYSEKLKNFDSINIQMTLSRCMSRNYSHQDIEYLLSENGISFDYEYFVLCAFEIYDVGELFGDMHKQVTNEEKLKDLTFIMDNIFTELFNKPKFRCELVTVLDSVFLLVNTDDEECLSGEKLTKTVEYALEFIEKEFYIKLSYVVSELYSGIGALPKAYNECMYLLRYKEAMGIEHPISINDTGKTSEMSFNAFPDTDMEQKLINCISSGNSEGAKLLIDSVFADISEKKLTLEQLQCVLVNIGCVLCKVPQNEITIDYEKILEHSKNTSQMKEFMKKTADKICENVKPVKFSKADMMADVAAYIEENYNSVINLNIIADVFEMSSNYLSVNFKQSMGLSIPDYINKVRLEKAKVLLKDSRLTIKEIAVETGFGNMRTFNRIYQKYEGITPSAYRNSAL